MSSSSERNTYKSGRSLCICNININLPQCFRRRRRRRRRRCRGRYRRPLRPLILFNNSMTASRHITNPTPIPLMPNPLMPNPLIPPPRRRRPRSIPRSPTNPPPPNFPPAQRLHRLPHPGPAQQAPRAQDEDPDDNHILDAVALEALGDDLGVCGAGAQRRRRQVRGAEEPVAVAAGQVVG